MLDVGESLRGALDNAQQRLRDAQLAVAHGNTARGSSDAALAETARAAIFEEAMLGALRARFNEMKAVTK